MAIIISIFAVVRAIKALKAKAASKKEVGENVNELYGSRKDIPNVKNIKLVSHSVGHIQPGLVFEDKNGSVLYECKLSKFRLMGSDDYEFTDVRYKNIRTLKIGKTISNATDDAFGLGLSVTTSSGFKIDGVNCWDYLRQRGFTVKHNVLEKYKNSYQLINDNQIVANIISVTSKDPWNEDMDKLIGRQPGSYRIEIIDAKLEDIVMAAFIIFKAETVE